MHQVREDIRLKILAALEIQIPLHEAALARLTVTENLDAWSSYHLGLQHMYRFNRKDNAAATALFQQAVTQDPNFARAHAGLSFVHFQTAFMHHSNDLAGEIALARRFAVRGLELDPIDPFVNFTMGRTFWLEGDLESKRMSVRTALSASSRVGRTGAEELARVRFELTTLSIRFLRPRPGTSMTFPPNKSAIASD